MTADPLRDALAAALDNEPLMISGIRRDMEITPKERGGVLHHQPGTPTHGGSGCPGDNLVRWVDDLRSLIAAHPARAEGGCPNDCEEGTVACWSPGGPCPENRTICESCGPCNHCRPGDQARAEDGETAMPAFIAGWFAHARNTERLLPEDAWHAYRLIESASDQQPTEDETPKPPAGYPWPRLPSPVEHFCDGKLLGCRCHEYQKATQAAIPNLAPTTPEGRIVADLREYVDDVTTLIHLFSTSLTDDPLTSAWEDLAHALLASDWLAAHDSSMARAALLEAARDGANLNTVEGYAIWLFLTQRAEQVQS
jgi:hypothetical protein